MLFHPLTFVLVTVAWIVVWLGYRSVHNVFSVLKKNDEKLWKEIGVPWLEFRIPLARSKFCFPTNTRKPFLKWIIKTPEWAKNSPDGKSAIFWLRVNLIGGCLFMAYYIYYFMVEIHGT